MFTASQLADNIRCANRIDRPGMVATLTLLASAGLGAGINGNYIDGFVAAGRAVIVVFYGLFIRRLPGVDRA